MSLSLHFAPEARTLFQVLQQALQASWKDTPLESPTIIVPNPIVKRWLQLQLAGKQAVLGANITTLERSLWKWLNPGSTQMAPAELYQLAISQILHSTEIHKPVFAPLNAYLGENPDSLRKTQLAQFLAKQFQEYEFNRPSVPDAGQGWKSLGMTHCWMENRKYDFHNMGEKLRRLQIQEEWQAELYRLVKLKLQSVGEAQYSTIPDLHKKRHEAGDFNPKTGRVKVFLVSKISHFHRNVLVQISQMSGCEIEVYLTNPCAEFWEDVNTARYQWRRKWASHSQMQEQGITQRSVEEYQLQEFSPNQFSLKDPKLLELWGNSTKENIALWCPPAEWNFEYHEKVLENENPSTLLLALQQSLLQRTEKIAPVTEKDSLQIIGAPSMVREVENVRDEILNALQKGTIQKLEDAVVYVNGIEEYLPAIQKVFGASEIYSADHIAFRLAQAPAFTSDYVQGLQVLLRIAQGNYTIGSIFQLFRNSIWQNIHNVTPKQVTHWESWVQQTQMIRGFDQEHREQMGDQGKSASEVYTVKLGLERLLLGNLVSHAVEMGYEVPLPGFRDYETSNRESLVAFIKHLESLYALSQGVLSSYTRSNTKVLFEIVESVKANIREIFTIPYHYKGNNASVELQMQADFLQNLNSLQAMAKIYQFDCFDFSQAAVLVSQSIPEESISGTQIWVNGFTILPFRSGLMLPHELIFVLGLGDKNFPGQKNTSSIDLLSSARIVGDSHTTQNNQQLFLETIHAAGQKLVLSYVSRNLKKDVVLQPSSTLLELEDAIKEFTERNEIEQLNWSVPSMWNECAKEIHKIANSPRVLQRFEYRSIAHGQVDAMNNLQITDIIDYLKDPLEYYFKKTLRIHEADESSIVETHHEPLEVSNFDQSIFRKEIWNWMLSQVYTIGNNQLTVIECISYLQQQIANWKISGKLPLPPMHIRWINQQEQVIKQYYKYLQDVIGKYPAKEYKLLKNAELSLGQNEYANSLSISGYSLSARMDTILVPNQENKALLVIYMGSIGRAKSSTDGFKALSQCIDLIMPSLMLWESRQERSLVDICLVDKSAQSENNAYAKCISWNTQISKIWKSWMNNIVRYIVSKKIIHIPYAKLRSIPKIEDTDNFDANTCLQLLDEKYHDEYFGYHNFSPNWKILEAQIPENKDEFSEAFKDLYVPIFSNMFVEQL